MSKIFLEKFEFLGEDPKVVARTPYKWMSKELINDIHRLPFTLNKPCAFSIELNVDGYPLILRATIPETFNFNEADIPFILQPIAYDKHSPFVKNASLVHDFILNERENLWRTWDLPGKGLTSGDFRYITSIVFGYILEQNAVPVWKAKLMALLTHLWQLVVPRWYRLKKEIN